jgi:tripartite-type tricarboxylate transporter receptor subunit TctC
LLFRRSISSNRSRSPERAVRSKDKSKRSATCVLGLIRKFGCLVVGATLLLATGGTRADNFPNKPVHILVPYAAGGAVDVLARTLGQSLAKTWGQQPVIDNRRGAGGIVASQALTQAAP